MRGALYRVDVGVLARVLGERDWPADALQLLGDAVRAAAGHHSDDVELAARRCVRELQERDWEGDADLAAQIEAAYGWAPTNRSTAKRAHVVSSSHEIVQGCRGSQPLA